MCGFTALAPFVSAQSNFKKDSVGFPGGPEAKLLEFLKQGAGFQSLVGELDPIKSKRSCAAK